jgi:Flp pilus assembly protein TadD
MASKASMVAAPAIVLLYDRAFEYDSFGEALRNRRWLYGGLAASWLVLVLLMWIAPRSTVGASESVSWQMYALNQAQIVGRYLRLAVWPRGLVLDYGLPQALSVRDVWPQALFIFALAIGVSIVWLCRPAAGFAGAVLFLALAPTSSVIPITSEVGAERRMYVPMMALVALAVAAGWWLLDRLRGRYPTASRPVTLTATAAVAGLVATLCTATIARNAVFGDQVALWRDVVDRRPHSRARLSLASALMAAGKGREAIAELRLAVRDYPEAKFGLGAALDATGQSDEAVAALTDFIALRPSDPSRIPARSLLGKVLAAQGKIDQAAAQFRSILDLDPSNREARESLADQLAAQERFDEAAIEYERVAAEVSRPGLELKLGMALQGANRLEAARRRFERALALDARSALAHRNLAEIAWEGGAAEEAVRHAEAALGLDPDDAATHNFLGVVLASTGRLPEAVVQFREALRIEPSNVRARENLARAERELSAPAPPQRRGTSPRP